MEYPPLTGGGGGNYPRDPSMGAPAAPGQSAIDLMIQHAATQYNIPPDILRALLMQESGMKAGAVGAAGEIGLGQFMPATAKALGIDASDPKQAIPGAALYLRQNLNRFGGNMDQALAAYNWGPGNVAKYGMAGAPASVKNYVSKILGMKGMAPPSGGGVGGAGTPGTAAPGLSPPTTSSTPLAQAVTPDMNPTALAMLGSGQLGAGSGGTLGDLFGNVASNFQQQTNKNVFGLA